MQIPGRLRLTRLPLVVLTAQQGRATGLLELVEAPRRIHGIRFFEGAVVAVDAEATLPRLAEVLAWERTVEESTLQWAVLRARATGRLLGRILVEEGGLSSALVEAALRRQMLVRLRYLEGLADAGMRFRAAVRLPDHLRREGLRLWPSEIPWKGTGEADPSGSRGGRGPGTPPRPNTAVSEGPSGAIPFGPTSHGRSHRFRQLGLSEHATAEDIKRAYRDLVRRYHPDLHPWASPDERRRLEARFAQVTEAYRTLVA